MFQMKEQNSRKRTKQNGNKKSRCRVQNTDYKDANELRTSAA